MKTIKSLFFLISLLLFSESIKAQGTNYPLWSPIYHILDRTDIKNHYSMNLMIRPYSKNSFPCKIDDPNNKFYYKVYSNTYKNNSIKIDSLVKTKKYAQFYSYLFKNGQDFIALEAYGNKNFALKVNPILSFQGGAENPSKKHFFKKNTRGIEVKGHIKNKLGFYSSITENQLWMNTYDSMYRQENGYLNGFAFNKNFKTGGVDYLNAVGYITFSALDRIHFQFGQSRTHIGNGIRSMIWDGDAPTTMNLKIKTDLGPVNYFNFFSKGVSDQFLPGNIAVTPKYFAYHRIGLNLTRNLNIGLSETIVFNNHDSNGTQGYKIDYLNPLIFYRSVEHGLGSADNAMMALDWKWNFLNQFQFYGQFLLDEFNLKYVKQANGWWANKFAGQVGLKYIDVATVKGLDLQYEANMSKPFTYSHYNPDLSFTHFNQSVSHYLGANFMEHIIKLRYQINRKMWIEWMTDMYTQGQDSINSNINYGGNVRLDNDSRAKEFGHSFLQGNKTKGFNSNIQFTYMPYHNVFLDLKFGQSKRSSVEKTREFNYNYLLIGIRINTGFGNTR